MAAIEVVVFAGAAGFAVIAYTILVVIGVGQKERRGDARLPGLLTIPPLLARRVLGSMCTCCPAKIPAATIPGERAPGTSARPARRPRPVSPQPGRPGHR